MGCWFGRRYSCLREHKAYSMRPFAWDHSGTGFSGVLWGSQQPGVRWRALLAGKRPQAAPGGHRSSAAPLKPAVQPRLSGKEHLQPLCWSQRASQRVQKVQNNKNLTDWSEHEHCSIAVCHYY